MKSTLKIALGENNSPVINFNVVPSDDLRDQLCCQWLHGLGYESNLCLVDIHSNIGPGDPKIVDHTLVLSPLPPNSHYICHKRVEEIYNSLVKKEGTPVGGIVMLTGGNTIGFYGKEGKGSGIELDREELRKMNVIDLVQTITDNFNSVVALNKE